jgi:hypothetical protein
LGAVDEGDAVLDSAFGSRGTCELRPLMRGDLSRLIGGIITAAVMMLPTLSQT